MALSGCAGHLKSVAVEAPKEAVPGVVDASITSFEDPGTRARMAAVVGSPEMQEVVRAISRSALEGALDDPRIDRAAIARVVQEEMVAATRAALREAAAEVPRSLGPALRSSIVEALRSPELREAIATTASDATHAALVGSSDTIQQLRAGGAPRPIESLMHWTIAAVVSSLGLGVAATALVAWALGLRRRAARTGEVARSLLQTCAEASRDQPWSEEMLAALARQMRADRARDLREIMRAGGAPSP